MAELRTKYIGKRTARRKPVSREEYILGSLERAFPTGHWVETTQDRGEGVNGSQNAIQSRTDPNSMGTRYMSARQRETYDPPPGAELPDGTPADPSDPRLKYAIQITGKPAILFTKKDEASKYAAAIVKQAKQRGATTAGSATIGAWRVFPSFGTPWAVTLQSKPKPPRAPRKSA